MCVCMCACVCVFMSAFIILSCRCDTRSVFKRVLRGLNSEFSFPKTGCIVKEPNLPNYLPIAGEITVAFLPFHTVLAL